MKRLSTPLIAVITLALFTLASAAGAGKLFLNTPAPDAPAGPAGQAPGANMPPAREATEAERAQVVESLGRMPLYFEENRGQAGPGVRYYSRAGNHTLLLSPSEVTLALRGGEGRSATLRMRMAGADRSPEVSGEGEQPGRVNYIRPRPYKSHTGVATFARVKYAEVYPGVDAVFYGNQRQLEYDFRVAPGADPSQVRLRFEGAERLRVAEDGSLLIQTAVGEVRQHKPFTYQEENGARTEVASAYRVAEGGEVTFELGDFDRSRELVIDPVLSYSTYFGSTGNDVITAAAIDADGNAYVTGSAFGSIPTTEGAFDRTLAGQDIFVAKLNPAGALVYSTYISAASGNNEAKAIAVDASGNAYVTGHAVSAVFTASAGAYDTTHNGSTDAFVAKLNPAGSALVYATYYGTSGQEFANAIAIDPSGDVYIAGHTGVANLPTKNALQSTYAGGSQFGDGDAFMARFSPDGAGAADLVYATYLGGTGDERARGVAADSDGAAYVVGSTNSNGFPTTAGAFDTGFNGGTDGFVTKIDTTATGSSSLAYSTFFGGTGADQVNAVLVDSAATPNVYVAGTTSSAASTFPVTAGSAQPALAGHSDAFFSRIDPSQAGAAALAYSTFVGGGGAEDGNAIARDSSGRIYVAGRTQSTNFPVTPDAFQATNPSGSAEAFAVKLDPAGAGSADRLFATYFGGNNSDAATGVGFDSAQNIYIAGTTTSTNLPTQNAAQSVYQGGNQGGDGFVVKLGSEAGTFSISGRVTNQSSGGAGFANIPVTLSGSATGVRVTDSQGNYTFTGLAAGGNYTLAPSRVNYTFGVPSQTVSNLSADTTGVDFAATINTYVISGRILQNGGPQSGQPLAGATVTLQVNNGGGAVLQSVTTNSNGDFAFDPQAAERTYFVSASMPAGAPRNYQFSPTGSSTVSNLAANATVNFTARPLYSVSGYVKDGSGNGIQGINVSLQFLRSVTTGANGFYSFTDIPAGDTRKIIPSKAGYNFTPVDRTYTSIAADITDFDFTGATQTYTISGKVTSNTSQPSGQPLSGVIVKLSGSQIAQTTTNASGDYSFTVGANGSYTVTPELADYSFTPGNKSVSNIASNQTANFTATQKFDMRGTVKDANNQPLSGVTISVNGAAIVTTGADGSFALNDRAGAQNYTIVPGAPPEGARR
ncbi:MAG TPA: SBBP repeat-containing protein [Pyrinomonadaceae bacterium]|nr:SBBP repeat-containing protein [Pyrinomonadaceae bacterium]